MKKMKFNVIEKKVDIVSLIKEINDISCRISINFESKLVTVKDVNDDVIDAVIGIIDKYYVITNVDIDNIVTEPAYNLKPIEETKTTPVSPIVEFKEHPDLLEKLTKTLNWALCSMNVKEQYIANYIYGLINEISMTYSPNPNNVDFNIGDVVDCSFGYHMPGEINGLHTHCIVCNVYKEMAFVVPITKHTGDYVISDSFVKFTPSIDITYNKFSSLGGTVLLDKGRYVRTKRINNVIGKTSAGFLKKILNMIPETFNFVK